MAKIVTIICTIVLVLGVTTGCQDELSERYQDPKAGVEPTIGEFFTAMLNNDRVRPSYWNVSTFINWHVGVYSQAVSYLNTQSMYQQNEAYIQERWDDFYRPGANGSGVMAAYREIEKAYNALPELQKAEAGLFYNAAKIVLYEQASQMVDLWGDIPFSQAGGLNATGELVYPRFDSAHDIYLEMIEDLKHVSHYFSSAEWTTPALTAFARQDILLLGNTTKWLQYCNSLRLRLLMRLSFVMEEFAKNQVLEMLNNPATYPMLDEMDYVPGANDVLLQPLTTYTYDLHEAFTDWTNYPAPYFALENVLKPANDLRIPVLYDRYGSFVSGSFNGNTQYNGLPLTLSMNDQKENIQQYAILDSVTFLFNSKLPGVVLTTSEINFLKAEAFERWGGGDPSAAYHHGIANSIKFYFYLNGLNTIGVSPSQKLTPPTNEDIDSFLTATEFLQYVGSREERLAKVWTQKWIHLGFLQATESWAELRRTGYPQLQFHPASLSGFESPPNRLTYPGSEKIYNDNYAKVSTNDFRDRKIFWHVE